MAWARKSAVRRARGPWPGVTRRERHRDHQRARRKMLPGRQDRADQRLRPGHDLGGPADQGQHQQARVQLSRKVAQLTDVTLVKGPPGRVSEHVAPGRFGRPGQLSGPGQLGVAQFGAHVLRAPPQLTERPVLGLAQRRDRPGQPDHRQDRRAPAGSAVR